MPRQATKPAVSRDSPYSTDGARSRVQKACDRCRRKKTKVCNGVIFISTTKGLDLTAFSVMEALLVRNADLKMLLVCLVIEKDSEKRCILRGKQTILSSMNRTNYSLTFQIHYILRRAARLAYSWPQRVISTRAGRGRLAWRTIEL